ncbi:MAG: hypothetical protein BM564_02545 [Bacteroidetes bacterium MedPE-SWsnd-G2]|mgnify:CR=1 FL=1|nr:MAG: hypothetical protein BM564_02545 [Bacteroidetes bacterium MedPE-SWsnd-G2]
MSNIEEVVFSLESKIHEVLHKMEVLKQTNLEISKELSELQMSNIQLQEEKSSWIEKYESLKIANTILGSNEDKRETKLKINTLIKDIDHCIAQLSE